MNRRHLMTDPIQGAAALGRAQELQNTAPTGAEKTADGKSFQDVFEEVQAMDPTPEAAPVDAPVEASGAAEQIDDFVQGVVDDQKRIQEMMDRCVSGDTMSQKELLELQSVIYGYAQKVDLASKIVDKATGGLKQVMNTQV